MNSLKRYALIIVSLIVITATANAGLRFGVKAGLNVDALHFNQKTFDSDNKCGWTAGVMGEFMVPGIGIGVDLSAMYTRMNNSINDVYYIDENAETQRINIGKNFIEIPLNLKYRLSLPVIEKIIKPYVFTGPTFAFKLDKDTFKDMKTKTCQVAWNVGLGVELINHLQVGASYGFGMNNIAKNWLDAKNLKVKNNYWTVTAAWLF